MSEVPKQCSSCGGFCGGGYTDKGGRHRFCQSYVSEKLEHSKIAKPDMTSVVKALELIASPGTLEDYGWWTERAREALPLARELVEANEWLEKNMKIETSWAPKGRVVYINIRKVYEADCPAVIKDMLPESGERK